MTLLVAVPADYPCSVVLICSAASRGRGRLLLVASMGVSPRTDSGCQSCSCTILISRFLSSVFGGDHLDEGVECLVSRLLGAPALFEVVPAVGK